MGNNTSCSNLQEYSNVCDMWKCLSKVTGLPSSSASNTDTWIIDFKDEVKYNTKPIKKAFVKIWLSKSSINHSLDKVFTDNWSQPQDIKDIHLTDIQSLNYEARIYRDIIKEFIETNVSPNFIKFLGLGGDCSFDEVSGMLKGSVENGNEKVALFRTTIALLDVDRSGRLSTTSSLKSYTTDFERDKAFVSVDYIQNNASFNVLVNESIKEGTKDVSTLSKKLHGEKGAVNNMAWAVVFQLMAAIYAMSTAGLAHNDLHMGNAYIEVVPVTARSYVYGGETFNTKNHFLVKVFDFDRSYTARFGDNKSLDAVCWASQCNEFIPNIDALKIMGLFYISCNNITTRRTLLDICAPNKRTFITSTGELVKPQELLKSVWDNGSFLVDPKTDDRLLAHNYESFSSVFYIMKKCAVLAGINSSDNGATLENTYVCNPGMFDANGKLLTKNVASLSKNEQLETELMDCKLQNLSEIKKIVELEKTTTIMTKKVEDLEEQLREADRQIEAQLNNVEVVAQIEEPLPLDKYGVGCKIPRVINNNTGRCNSPPRTLKECNENQERNPVTRRCRKLKQYGPKNKKNKKSKKP
jgi:hypothetical protein